MTTISSKHIPRESGEPPMTVYQGQTLVDDMEIIRKLCLPERNRTGQNMSHLSFGKPDPNPLMSTHQADFVRPPLEGDTKSEREARSQDMRSKHFEFGFGPLPPMQSENRGLYVNHGLPRDKKVHGIGGPNNKNASSVFASDQDRAHWAADLASTSHTNYLHPGIAPDKSKGHYNHRANHFDFGFDAPEKESVTKGTYKGPPAGYQPVKALKIGAPSVQLGSRDYPWAQEVNSTNRTDFCKPAVFEEDALTDFVAHTPLQFGEDTREMLTEYRGAYKKNEFMDCNDLTDEQLTMLGVTREQILPQKLPLKFLSEGFRNSLGQRHAQTL